MEQVKQEISILNTYKHNNIIKLIDIIENEEYIYVILEQGECDLYTYILNNNKLKEYQIKYIFKQMCLSISYLHSNHLHLSSNLLK